MWMRSAVCGMALLGSIAALPAQAQGLMFLSKAPAGAYTEADWKVLSATANELLDNGKPGEQRGWSNPATGNSGELQLASAPDYKGASCRRLVFTNHAKGIADPSKSAHVVCKADKAWKILK